MMDSIARLKCMAALKFPCIKEYNALVMPHPGQSIPKYRCDKHSCRCLLPSITFLGMKYRTDIQPIKNNVALVRTLERCNKVADTFIRKVI